MRKVRNKDCYKVYNTINKRVFAKCTTRDKAMRQLAILRSKVYSKSLKKPSKNPSQQKTKKNKKPPLLQNEK